MIGTIDMTIPAHLLTAREASRRLGVSLQTLYSYVSRSLVRATPDARDPRRSLYDARDVAALVERRGRGRARRVVAASTTNWGEPILRSSLCHIVDGTFRYRGQDAIALSETATLEEVATLLWDAPVTSVPASEGILAGTAPFGRCLRAVAEAAARENASRGSAAATATRLLGLVAHAACGGLDGDGTLPLHERMANAWGLDQRGADLLRRALVLCADHELNASAYAARVVASTGASLAACVLAGLAALSGPRHGGMTEAVLRLAAAPDVHTDLAGALASRLARDGGLPGFGHRLYPDGDPRCRALLACHPPDATWAALIEAAVRLTGRQPTVDVALAMLEATLPLPPGTGLALFATGRTVGWIAHALEQRGEGRLIRPRAEYLPLAPRQTG